MGFSRQEYWSGVPLPSPMFATGWCNLFLPKYIRRYIYMHYEMSFLWDWVIVQSLSHIQLFVTPWPAAHRLPYPSLSARVFSDSCSLNLPPHTLLPPSPFAFNFSQYQHLFQWISSLYQVAKVLELQLQHQSFQWISGLISFKIDWFDLLAVLGTLKSVLQPHSSKASILWCSAFFMIQLSYPYMTTEKN